MDELIKVSKASGLEHKKLFDNTKTKSLRDAFTTRNQIIHEMDINISSTQRTPGYRTRRTREVTVMRRHTKSIFNLAESLFVAYKDQFDRYKIGIEKRTK